jgi:hypothetical protein
VGVDAAVADSAGQHFLGLLIEVVSVCHVRA